MEKNDKGLPVKSKDVTYRGIPGTLFFVREETLERLLEKGLKKERQHKEKSIASTHKN